MDSVVQALCVFAATNDWEVSLRGCVPMRKLSAEAAAALGAEQGTRWRRRLEKEQQQQQQQGQRGHIVERDSAGTGGGCHTDRTTSVQCSQELTTS